MSTKKKEWEEEETAKQQQNVNNSYISGYSSPYQQIAKDALDRWQNREDFTYDLNADALYNQYKNSYMQQGKLAMKDTMGQAAALTGGYGNSYAQTVGQQSYQGYLQQLNDLVPELYEAAYNRYQQEGTDLYNEWQVAQSLESQDYSRFMDKVAQDQWQQQFDADEAYRKLQQEQWQQQFDADEAYRKWQMSQASKSSSSATKTTVAYDNGTLDTSDIKIIQEYLGIKPTGYWDETSYYAAGGLSADSAFLAMKGAEGWKGDEAYIQNYKAQTPSSTTNYNYEYSQGMYKPATPTLSDREADRIDTEITAARESGEYDVLYELYKYYSGHGYNVDYIKQHIPTEFWNTLANS